MHECIPKQLIVSFCLVLSFTETLLTIYGLFQHSLWLHVEVGCWGCFVGPAVDARVNTRSLSGLFLMLRLRRESTRLRGARRGEAWSRSLMAGLLIQ